MSAAPVQEGVELTPPTMGMTLFRLIIRVAGRAPAYMLLYVVCACYVLFNAQVRRSCAPYLRRRFPRAVGFYYWWHCYRLVHSFGRSILDRVIASVLGSDTFAVSLRGRDTLFRLRDEGRGMILLLSHVGCWQMAVAAFAALEQPVYMLMHHHASVFEQRHGGGFAFEVIDPNGYLGGALEMLGVLKDGGILAIMGDRVPPREKNVVRVPLLGGEVALPVSAYHLASSTGAPIVVLTSHRRDDGSYLMEVAEVLEVPRALGRRCDSYRPYACRYAAVLERYCARYPYQFYNFFDMWQ